MHNPQQSGCSHALPINAIHRGHPVVTGQTLEWYIRQISQSERVITTSETPSLMTRLEACISGGLLKMFAKLIGMIVQ